MEKYLIIGDSHGGDLLDFMGPCRVVVTECLDREPISRADYAKSAEDMIAYLRKNIGSAVITLPMGK